MIEDPQTTEQIEALSRDDRPLLVLDVDEVVLEFIAPLVAFLRSRDLHLRTDSFRLFGNVVDAASLAPLRNEDVTALLDDFFCAQHEWQTPVEGAVDALHALRSDVEIVMLTSMPHRHRMRRRSMLDGFGLDFPLVTTEAAKGHAILRLRGRHPRPVAFVDDLPGNLASARAVLSQIHLLHMMSFAGFRNILPALPDGTIEAANWPDAQLAIATAFSVSSTRSTG